MADSSDEELLAGVRRGDRAALAALYDRHAPWLTLRLARRCADAGIVDEVVQDTFLAVWRGAGRFAGTGGPGRGRRR
jgi:RNA polymerase sigma-70 factor (ECF subfamily)